MAGIREQRHRIGREAEDDLDNDERQVEGDSNQERTRQMVICVIVMMVRVAGAHGASP